MPVVLVAISEPKGGTSSNLFEELSDVIRSHCTVYVVQPEKHVHGGLKRLLVRLWLNGRAILMLLSSNVIFLHVYATAWLPLIITAWLLRKRIVIFQWDVYPITLKGEPFNATPLRRILDTLEVFIIGLATKIVVPSNDFLPYLAKSRTPYIIPLWPQRSLVVRAHTILPVEDCPIHVAFAGQVNATRGLLDFVNHALNYSEHPIHLHIFSSSNPIDLEALSPTKVQITHHGHLKRDELQAEFARMHFGLICLSPFLDQPAFPSKTYDYLAAGLPLVYFGPQLQGFLTPLLDSDLVVTLTPETRFNLDNDYPRISIGFETRRAKYFAANQLEWSRVAEIL